MGKKKILEQSRLRVSNQTIDNQGKTHANKMLILLPIIFILAGLVVFVFSISLDETGSPSKKISRNLGGNFGFMKKTESWAQNNLTLTIANKSIDLTENFENIKTYKKFAQKGEGSIRPRTLALTQITFQSLGVTNPWQAFELNDEIRGFDLDAKKLYTIMSQEILPQVNRLSQNAILEIEGNKATRVRPDVIGQSLDIKETELAIRRSIFENRSEANLVIVTNPPEIKLSETNDLGIKELVATGESNFSGSSQSRITNIRVGASRFHGLILKPGEEFSFNDNLGPVTAKAGFLPELVIKSFGTIPELGGGLCQVSTTAFRAAFYGGLNITARKNHSYAVSYYAPQGTDATLYPGVVDFKFINDTPAYLLISTRVEDKRLIFDFYGTADGRKVVVDGPYQYDFTPGGASKAVLSRTVTLGQVTRTDDFYSRYVSKNLFPVTYEYPKDPKTIETEATDTPDIETEQEPVDTSPPSTEIN